MYFLYPINQSEKQIGLVIHVRLHNAAIILDVRFLEVVTPHLADMFSRSFALAFPFLELRLNGHLGSFAMSFVSMPTIGLPMTDTATKDGTDLSI